MIENITGLVMCLGSIVIIIQNYSYWRQYRDRETALWILAAAFTIFVSIYFYATRYLVPITLDNVGFLTWSRHVLISLGFLAWIILGFRTYILRK
jgi:hypothetical protein